MIRTAKARTGDLLLSLFYTVQEKRLELSWYCYHTDLNRARLPIPPFLHPYCTQTSYPFTLYERPASARRSYIIPNLPILVKWQNQKYFLPCLHFRNRLPGCSRPASWPYSRSSMQARHNPASQRSSPMRMMTQPPKSALHTMIW